MGLEMPVNKRRQQQMSDDIVNFYSAVGFRDVLPNQHVRQGMTRDDYDYYRPSEATPKDIKKVLQACDSAYKTSLVKNIIDLMGDFASQGINIVHPDKRSQATLRRWFFDKVNGKDRSERFLNLFYRQANVIVHRQTAKINKKINKELKRAEAEPDIEVKKAVRYKKGEIPWKYTFFNPQTINIINPELASFSGKIMYSISISENLKTAIKKAQDSKALDEEKEMLKEIPPPILALINAGKREIPLDMTKVRSFYYKKDDWDIWATPMIYPILPEIKILEKLGLSDATALDGVISQIRLWRLGKMEQGVKPAPAAFTKLSDVLQNHLGGGVMDLIWDEAIDVEVLNSESYKFLGIEKYIATFHKIFIGLGIPQSLSGGDQKGGFTNNAIAVKTLIERLNYGRDALVSFWKEELEIVQKQLGIKPLAQLQFERMTLSDEAAEKALWIQLVDRDLISIETFQERFGESPLIERLRKKKEKEEIKKGKMVDKMGQWKTREDSLEEKALQNGMLTPSQVGLDVPPPKPEEDLLLKKNFKPTEKPGGTPGQGRPKSSKDSTKRKAKRVVPIGANASVNRYLWATNSLKKISEIIMPAILQKYEKTNARQLTEEQFTSAENLKFAVLCHIGESTEISQEAVAKTLGTLPAQNKVYNIYEMLISNLGHKPTADDCRILMCQAYCIYEESKNA